MFPHKRHRARISELQIIQVLIRLRTPGTLPLRRVPTEPPQEPSRERFCFGGREDFACKFLEEIFVAGART